MKDLLESLTSISKPPAKDQAGWLSSAEISIEFLKRSTRSERTVLFASMPAVLIHAVLAPLDALDPPDQADLGHDFIMPDDRWAIEYVSGGGEPDRSAESKAKGYWLPDFYSGGGMKNVDLYRNTRPLQ